MKCLRKSIAAALFVAVAGLPVAAENASDQRVRQLPPELSIAEDLNKIEAHMVGFGDLSDSLGAAAAELQTDFDRYMDDPKNEVLASGIEKKMAIFADQVVQDFDTVIADQDLIVVNFKDLRRKLGGFDTVLDDKLGVYGHKLDRLREQAEVKEQGLIELALKIKETRDPDESKELLRSFNREYRRFRLKNRNLRGLERNLHNYQVLVDNLQSLTGLFTQLQDKFVALIENLESEKEYLLEAIELQQDSVKIKKIMNDGIFSGERAIKNVTKRLAQLYLRVDAFTQVHDRINMGLGRFAETQETLTDLSSQIDRIGTGVGLDAGESPNSIQDAVEYFASKKNKLRVQR